MRETILNKLKQEHRQVEFLMAQIEHCHDIAQKKSLYLELEALLLAHMEGEERTLYSELKQVDADEEAFHLASDADQEHRGIKELMAQLDQTGIENQDWKRVFDELKARIQEHVEEEETELFAEAREDFSLDELADFAEEFEKLKHQISL
jgi:hypothetical protein